MKSGVQPVKQTLVLKSRIAELQGELQRATAERAAALTQIAKRPSDDAAHARLSAAITQCKQLKDVIDAMGDTLPGAERADAAATLTEHWAEMLAARDRMQSAVVARVQVGAKIDKALDALRGALTDWQSLTSTAARELGQASAGALEGDAMLPSQHDNRLMSLGAVSQQLFAGSPVPLAFARGLRAAGVLGAPGEYGENAGAVGPIPLDAIFKFSDTAADALAHGQKMTVREASLVSGDDAALTLGVLQHLRSPVVPVASLTKGTTVFAGSLPTSVKTRRYLGVIYTVVGTMTAGALTAAFVADLQTLIDTAAYAKGFTV
jgi:hypothetical protein